MRKVIDGLKPEYTDKFFKYNRSIVARWPSPQRRLRQA